VLGETCSASALFSALCAAVMRRGKALVVSAEGGAEGWASPCRASAVAFVLDA
jgi:hypothetical protein